ncbi:hypothetical protein ACFYZ8_32145 [Streptomyces sp. NPDC001668]|uniref:hypothetical protein n=1 Tax=Streptomyces sp. NPDC001668 TaxID=3364598 RepID=UPI0036C0C616
MDLLPDRAAPWLAPYAPARGPDMDGRPPWSSAGRTFAVPAASSVNTVRGSGTPQLTHPVPAL